MLLVSFLWVSKSISIFWGDINDPIRQNIITLHLKKQERNFTVSLFDRLFSIIIYGTATKCFYAYASAFFSHFLYIVAVMLFAAFQPLYIVVAIVLLYASTVQVYKIGQCRNKL